MIFDIADLVDTKTNPKAPLLHKVVVPEEMISKTGLAYPHTFHCLASGDIMIPCLNDKEQNAEGNGFLIPNSEFNVIPRAMKGMIFSQHLSKEATWKLHTLCLMKFLKVMLFPRLPL